MKKLFYLLMVVGFLAFVGCSSTSNSGGGKFLGTWKEQTSRKTLIITKGKEGTYDILQPKIPEIQNGREFNNKGFKYDPDRNVLYKNKGTIMEIFYNSDSGTIQPSVNHILSKNPFKKVK